VRSRLAWLVGLAGLAALLRRRRPRRAEREQPFADPAAELRRRLDAVEEPPTAVEPEPARADLDERRRQVHESGRAALDEMGGASPDG
jgi:hypothetical protein